MSETHTQTATIIMQKIKRLYPNMKASVKMTVSYSTVILGKRMIQINSSGIHYGVNDNTVHPHGRFPMEAADLAVDFLVNPEKMPPSIREIIIRIITQIRVPFALDAMDPWKPSITTKNGCVRFGLFSPLTMNFYYPDGSGFGLVNEKDAIGFLSR